MTGDAATIRAYRERAKVGQAIAQDATNLAAMDRFNELSELLSVLDPDASMGTIAWKPETV